MTSSVEDMDAAVWGFAEVFMATATFLLASILVAAIATALLGSNAKLGYWGVVEQSLVYVAVFLVLKAFARMQGLPLLPSLGWVKQQFSVTGLAVSGVLLMFGGLALQLLLRTPLSTDTRFDKMMYGDRLSPFVLAAFGVTMGPIIEELLFRGLIQPVFVNAAGVFPGILLTSLFFGAIHVPQYGWVWQSGLVLTAVSFGFGTIRHVSGSTRASTISHVAYNALPFAVTLLQGAPPIHK
jgi:membrane protease YdiL (CAAX protease family)